MSSLREFVCANSVVPKGSCVGLLSGIHFLKTYKLRVSVSISGERSYVMCICNTANTFGPLSRGKSIRSEWGGWNIVFPESMQ